MRILTLSLLLLTAPAFASYEVLIASTDKKVVEVDVDGTISTIVEKSSGVVISTEIIHTPVGWLGSGAIIAEDGFVLTCSHIFQHKLEDRKITVTTSTGHIYKAMILQEDRKHDLTLLKIFPQKKLPFFTFGANLKRGMRVMSFGSPLAYKHTVSIGFITNLDIGDRKLVMHSASINSGNSGGPLVTTDGKLVGINIQVEMENLFSRAEGMNEAVSLKDIRKFLKE